MKKSKYQRLKKRYTERNLRFRNLRFRIFYVLLLGAIAFGMYTLYVYVDDFLVEYEKAQSRHVIEDMASMFVEKRFDEVYQYEDRSLLGSESREDYVAYLNELTEGAHIDYREIPGKNPDERIFRVTSNGKSFATFTIRKSGEVSDCSLFGLIKDVELYEPGTVSTDVVQPISYQVRIPSTASLLVNGEPAPEEYIYIASEATFATGHLPEGYPEYNLTTYRFTLALGVPEIKAIDASGAELPLTEASQDVWEYTFDYRDDILRPVHEKNAVEAAKAICKYMSKNTYQNDVVQYMLDGSPAEKSIREADVYWVTKASDYSFDNIQTKNYVFFSDTVFSCEVYMDYTTVTKGKDNTYNAARRFYFTLSDDEWLIYDFENIETH